MTLAPRRSLRLSRLNKKGGTDTHETMFQLPDSSKGKGRRLTPLIRSVSNLGLSMMMLSSEKIGVNNALYENGDDNGYDESDASESYSSSETASTSTHEGNESINSILEFSSVKSIESHAGNDEQSTMGDTDERTKDNVHHDFKMSVSYESNLGWTTASGSSSKADVIPKKRMQRRRSTVGWKEAVADESTTNGPSTSMIVKTRSGRIVRPVSKSESLPSLKKRRTTSDPYLRRRATTPPSASPASRSEPERPQSAMKHKSANRYLQGKEEPIIIVTSRDRMPQTENSPNHSPFLSVMPLPSRQKTLRVLPVRDNDPDAFSPAQNSSRYSLPLFVLRSRASLPKNDFYERHKREEGSPTPETRKYG